MKKLVEDIKNYVPFNEQEAIDKEVLLDALTIDNIFLRENKFMHMSASSWIVNKNYDKVLMIYHKIYDSWSWLGGHADGNENLLEVSCKELEEESGLKNYKLVSELPFSIEVLTVDGHIKKNRYVNSHLHLNVTYLFEVDEDETLITNELETKGIKWIPIDELENEVSEIWFMENIYKKLLSKMEALR